MCCLIQLCLSAQRWNAADSYQRCRSTTVAQELTWKTLFAPLLLRLLLLLWNVLVRLYSTCYSCQPQRATSVRFPYLCPPVTPQQYRDDIGIHCMFVIWLSLQQYTYELPRLLKGMTPMYCTYNMHSCGSSGENKRGRGWG